MIIKIKVKTNSRKQEIIQLKGDEYLISLKESPDNNKANKELLKLLNKKFKKEVKILKGLRSKNKIVEII